MSMILQSGQGKCVKQGVYSRQSEQHKQRHKSMEVHNVCHEGSSMGKASRDERVAEGITPSFRLWWILCCLSLGCVERPYFPVGNLKRGKQSLSLPSGGWGMGMCPWIFPPVNLNRKNMMLICCWGLGIVATASGQWCGAIGDIVCHGLVCVICCQSSIDPDPFINQFSIYMLMQWATWEPSCNFFFFFLACLWHTKFLGQVRPVPQQWPAP